MMFRFIGEYTNKHTSINAGGVMFQGREPSEVECPELIRRLTANIEFEAVGDDLSELRAAYTEQFGKKPFHGWDADTLRDKMNADPVEG